MSRPARICWAFGSASASMLASVIEHVPAPISAMCFSSRSTRLASLEGKPARLRGFVDRVVKAERPEADREGNQLGDGAHHHIRTDRDPHMGHARVVDLVD